MGAGIEALNCMNCKGIILKNILQTKKENTNESSGSETLKDEFYNGLKDFNGENTKKPIIDSLKSINLLNEKPKAPYFLDQPDFFNLLSSIEESPPINDDKFKIEKITKKQTTVVKIQKKIGIVLIDIMIVRYLFLLIKILEIQLINQI